MVEVQPCVPHGKDTTVLFHVGRTARFKRAGEHRRADIRGAGRDSHPNNSALIEHFRTFTMMMRSQQECRGSKRDQHQTSGNFSFLFFRALFIWDIGGVSHGSLARRYLVCRNSFSRPCRCSRDIHEREGRRAQKKKGMNVQTWSSSKQRSDAVMFCFASQQRE